MTHLLKRIEQGAEAGYVDYQREEETLDGSPVERMSKLTDALLRSIDYEKIALDRISNYKVLEEQLGKTNAIHLTLHQGDVPMVYPYLTEDTTLKQRLITHKIFVATYWPNVDANENYEATLKTNLLPLPIDQRYWDEDMKRIIENMKLI